MWDFLNKINTLTYIIVFSLLAVVVTGVSLVVFRIPLRVDLQKTLIDKENIPINTSPTKVNTLPASIPTPTIVMGSGKFACGADGVCRSYGDPIGYGKCPVTFADSRCQSLCNDQKNWCKQ